MAALERHRNTSIPRRLPARSLNRATKLRTTVATTRNRTTVRHAEFLIIGPSLVA